MRDFLSTIVGLAIVVGMQAQSRAELLYMHGVGNQTLSVFDTNSNTETVVGNTGISQFGGLAMSGGGVLFGITFAGNLYSINANTAVSTLIGSTGASNAPEGLAFGLDGTTLYTSGGGDLFSVNTTTGVGTSLGTIGMPDVDGLTVAPVAITTNAGVFAAGTIFAIDNSTLYAINPNSLVTTTLGTTQASEAIAFDASGNLFVHNFSNALYSINPLTLGATFVANTSNNITGLTGVRAAVPEPTSLALWSLGLVGMTFARRRRS